MNEWMDDECMRKQMNMLNGLCSLPTTQKYNCACVKARSGRMVHFQFRGNCSIMWENEIFSPNNLLNLARYMREKGCFSNLGMWTH